MNVLAICSALNNSYLGFKYNGETLTYTVKSDEKNYHSLYLISKIKEVAKEKNIDLNKLDLIAINAGPGSFTGIRVAFTIAKVMAGVLNIPIVTLNSAEVLLEAFGCDTLIMDARRDMYYIGTKDKIELIYKDKIDKSLLKGKLLTDKRCIEFYPDATCFEDENNNKDISNIIINLAIKKYNSKDDKDEFNYLRAIPNYIQTPPVF